MPYVPVSFDASESSSSAYSNFSNAADLDMERRAVMFHWSGHLNLYGPELVCSVRQAILQLSGQRADLQLFNASLATADGPLRSRALTRSLRRATFCLVAKGDSYSSSLFYHAIAMGCIPVVISDWFVFSYPWIGQVYFFSIDFSFPNSIGRPSALRAVRAANCRR